MTGKMMLHIVLIVMMYTFLIWMIVRKRRSLLEHDGPILTKTETWLLVGGVILLIINGIMLIVDFQIVAGRSKAVSIMIGCIGCFLLMFFGPNFRIFAYLFDLFAENSKRKRQQITAVQEQLQEEQH